MEKKIVYLSPVPPDMITNLLKANGYDDTEGLTIVNANPMSEEETINEVKDAEIIIGDFTFNRPVTRAIAEASAESVKLIQQPSVGYQHIDIQACSDNGIRVANTAGANTAGVAEHTVMMGMFLIKKIMHAHKSTFSGEWKQMDIGAGEINGKTWGIVGMGKVGRALAERLIPFELSVIYYDVNRLGTGDEKKLKAGYADLEELVKQSDIISLHCPLTSETENLINEERIAMMKPNAVIINVARGEIVDEKALATALTENSIAGASLDVFSVEPITKDNPLLSVTNDNLVLTPHIAGATNESKGRIINLAFSNIARVLQGKKPESLITG